MHTASDVAYCAGFFDGEGHIRIQRHSTRGSYMLSISAVQSTLTPLDMFANLFGGKTKKRITKYRGEDKAIYEWQASSALAERVLREMYPYLRAKKDEADIAFAFRETFRPQYGDRSRLDQEVVSARKDAMLLLQATRIAKRELSRVAYA